MPNSLLHECAPVSWEGWRGHYWVQVVACECGRVVTESSVYVPDPAVTA